MSFINQKKRVSSEFIKLFLNKLRRISRIGCNKAKCFNYTQSKIHYIIAKSGFPILLLRCRITDRWTHIELYNIFHPLLYQMLIWTNDDYRKFFLIFE